MFGPSPFFGVVIKVGGFVPNIGLVFGIGDVMTTMCWLQPAHFFSSVLHVIHSSFF